MPITVNCNNPPGAVVGVFYSHFFSQTGGGANTVFGIFPGTLPSGLFLNSVTGEVSGTPNTDNWTPAEVIAGHSIPSLTVEAFDPATLESDSIICGVGAFLNSIPISPSCNNPPGGSIGFAYTHAVSATGGIPAYVFAITAGALPDGLSMDSAGNITGVPSANGFFTFTITVTGQGDPLNNVAVFTCSISIGDASPAKSPQLYFFSFGFLAPLSIGCGDPPNGVLGSPYTHLAPIIPGGTPPYTYAITAGALPTGLALDDPPNTSIITGIPTVPGVFPFTIEVTDSLAVTADVDCSIEVVAALSIICDNPPAGATGVFYSHTFPVSGGVPPYSYLVTFGVLPGGLTLDPDTGIISGTPNAAGVFPFTVRVTDSYTGAALPNTDFVECSITITGESGPLGITCDNPPDGALGVAYTHTLPVSGGTPPYTFAIIAGVLPNGLTIGANSGLISGTPTVGGLFTFTTEVTDADLNTSDVECSILIDSDLVILCDSPPPGKLTVPYSHTFPASGGTEPYTFSIVAGALPPGLSLGAGTGVISGTPTLSGFYEFTIMVTDDDGAQSVVTCSIRIKQCLLVDLG